MPEQPRGAGVLFSDKHQGRVSLYRRDNTPPIPFPDHLDLLGGHLEAGESPEQNRRAGAGRGGEAQQVRSPART